MVRKCISCVMKISDGITRKPLASSQVRICADGAPVKHEYKQGGYFVLLGLAEGRRVVTVSSPCFQTERLEVLVDYSTVQRPEGMVRYLMLNPSQSHPLAASMPAVRGTAEGFERIFVLRHGGELKIAEDNAQAGHTAVRLFSPKGGVALPSMYRISDRSAARCELVMLKGADGDMYMLDEPLKYPHPRSADVVPVISVSCTDSGEFFFMLSPEFRGGEDGISLVILAQREDKSYTAEVTASPKGITDIGALKLGKG